MNSLRTLRRRIGAFNTIFFVSSNPLIKDDFDKYCVKENIKLSSTVNEKEKIPSKKRNKTMEKSVIANELFHNYIKKNLY